jgi:hypothetical protein
MKIKGFTRRDLVEHLETLLSDEFDSSELVYLTDGELVQTIINAAYFYQEEYNN